MRHCLNLSNGSKKENCPHIKNYKDFLGSPGNSTINSKAYNSSREFLCRKFETVDTQSVLQQIVPPSMIQEILSACHSSPTAGHLGVAKTTEKMKQRFYWPGLQDDTKLFVSWCPECQKRSGPPKRYHHALVEWTPSYPFQHIGIDFMGPLPMSNGNKHILVIGDHFTNWYEVIPLPNRTGATFANALVDHWISRFGCPHSLHSDQGRSF